MALIPEQELERLKRETDLVALVRSSGVELTQHGADWIGLCPHHDDHQPSLVVSPSKGLWHCLGKCNAGGSAIDWAMKNHSLTFREAVLQLQGLRPTTRRTTNGSSSIAAGAGDVLTRAWQHYRAAYASTPAASAYASARGIGATEAAERFGFGYAAGTLLEGLGREHLAALVRLGLINGNTQREHLAGCLVLPVLDSTGRVLNLYGRRIDDSAEGPKHLYLPGPRRGVFNVEAFRSTTELILCESLIDALTFWCHGLHHVTTSYGVNGFTEDLHQAIASYGIERVLIAYDRDDAGDKAALALAKQLGGEGIGCFRVLFPRGVDANAYALKVTPAEPALALAVNSAEWLAGPKTRPAAATTENNAVAPHPAAPAAATAERVSSLAAASAGAASAALAPKPATKEEKLHLPAGIGIDPFEVKLGERRYRVRGLLKNLSYDKLQVLLRVSCGERFFLDSLDLVSSKQRKHFLHQAALELETKEEVLQKDLARVHLALEELQEELIQKELAPKAAATAALSPAEEREALAFLKRPDLLAAILADFERCGVVGEETNKLVGYLAAVSRKLDRPLAVILQSSSAAGKSALLEAILALVPEEERVQYSAMTGQSLFYMGESDLKHKVLAIAEEEGAERASYALKLLQSEGELTIASTGKDPQTGKLVTHEYRVEGPVAILLTTTAIEVDEELLNRCIVLTVDEDREQTRAIHRRQREGETLEGLLAERERELVVKLHRNAQRLLNPLLVANPFARQLTFLDDRTRTRRDHVKYLTLIRTIALLHQYQRPRKTAERDGVAVEYIEVTPGDILTANRLAHEVLGRSLDELPPQTRKLLELLDHAVRENATRAEMQRADFFFSRRWARETTGWSDAQVRKHIERLVELEYVLSHRAARGQGVVYELLYDGQGRDGRPFLIGLLDVERLEESRELTPKTDPLTPQVGGSDSLKHPGCNPVAPQVHGAENRDKPKRDGALRRSSGENAEKPRYRSK
jgi:DNA primase